MGTAERRLEIMKYLCRKRHATMPELSREFCVSLRTIQRDIFELSLMMPIITRPGKQSGGVYVIGDYTMDRIYMSEKEISLLTKIKHIVEPQLSQAEKTLLNHIIETYTKNKKTMEVES